MKIHLALLLLSAIAFQVSFATLNLQLDSSSIESTEQNSDSGEIACGKGEYFSERAGKCELCTACGSNLYVKSKCRDNQDTICDWCLSENPVLNENFFQECNDYKKLVERFRKLWKDDLQEERVESDAKYLGNWTWLFYSLLAGVACMSLILSFWLFCARRQYTRVITVAPPQLTEADNHNIIYAAKQIRDKLTKKSGSVDYEYL
ncbi:TNFR-Cys domain-containing protein [Aphelenchoides bicaudatus]|nr:TNFR-Cys domain-containing protein [Aphelenchoides bicaudatus]